MFNETRSEVVASLQVAKMGEIDLKKGNFTLGNGKAFQLKNDGTTPVELEVRLYEMEEGQFVKTKFDCGWNPEIIGEIKQSVLSNLNLKWGY